jgi:predicted GNAT family N-acyltransferase
MTITVKLVSWHEHEVQLRTIRTAVFVDEQKVPQELEWDEHDENAYHWLVFDNQRAVGTCRMLKDGHIGRMAILAIYRGKGIGTILLNAVIEKASQDNLFQTYLYAQKQAENFYKQAGFITQGEEFLDANIAHITMRLNLQDKRQLGIHGGNFAVTAFYKTVIDLTCQATAELRILNRDLNPLVFDTIEMETILSQLARSSRYSQVKILILDPRRIIQNGHCLLRLQRRIPSIIQLRTTSTQAHDIKENVIIADRKGFICQSINDPEKIWANYNNKAVAKDYVLQFEELWQRSREDARLRQLDI